MSNIESGFSLLKKFLLEEFNIEVHIELLREKYPAEFHILIWSFCTKTLQKKASVYDPPKVFNTGYKANTLKFFQTQVGFHLYFKLFSKIW